MTQTCPICENEFASLDSHHIYPLSFGGPQDGPQISLCAGCHQGIHSHAKQASAKNNKGKNYLVSEDALKRAAFLINAIVTAEQNYKRGIVPDGFDPDIHQVSCWVDRDTLKLLHSAKNILKFNSLDSLMKAAIKVLITKAHGIDLESAKGERSRILDPKRQRVIRSSDSG